MNQNSKTQKEIEEIREKDFKRLLIILLPFLLLFIIEHFGEFNVVASPYYGNDNESKSYISRVDYETPFGSEFSEDLRGEKHIFNFLYDNKFPFYIKGVFEDIWYAVIPSLIILLIFLYNRFLSIQVSKQTDTNIEINDKQDINTINEAIDNLKELKEKGILNEEEYNSKSEKIQLEILENQILNSTEYLQLKNLYDLKVLSKEEFESKVEKIGDILKDDKINNNNTQQNEILIDSVGSVVGIVILVIYLVTVVVILTVLVLSNN